MNLEPLFKYWQKLPCSVQLRCLNHMDVKTRKSLRMCSWDEKHLVEFFVEWSKFKWRDLPLKVQMKCVELMDRDTRTSLKLCCWDEKHLVEYVPSRKLEYCIEIKQGEDSQYFLKHRKGKNIYQVETTFEKIGSIENIRKYIKNEISNYDEFEKIDLVLNDTPGLQLSSHRYLLKCKKLRVLFTNCSTVIKVLKQFDPKFLTELRLLSNGQDLHYELCNMIQMNLECLHLYYIPITDNQLMQLNAKELTLYDFNELTSAGINKYIKKQFLSSDQSNREFFFRFKSDANSWQTICRDLDVVSEKESDYYTCLIINSPFPDIQLEVNVFMNEVTGRKIVKKNHQEKEKKT